MSQKFRMDSEGIPLDPESNRDPQITSNPKMYQNPGREPLLMRTISTYTLEPIIGQVRRDCYKFFGLILPKIITFIAGQERIFNGTDIITCGTQQMIALTLFPQNSKPAEHNISYVHESLNLEIWAYRSQNDNIMAPFHPLVISDPDTGRIHAIRGYEVHKPLSIWRPYVLEIVNNNLGVSRMRLDPNFVGIHYQLVPLTEGL